MHLFSYSLSYRCLKNICSILHLIFHIIIMSNYVLGETRPLKTGPQFGRLRPSQYYGKRGDCVNLYYHDRGSDVASKNHWPDECLGNLICTGCDVMHHLQ